MRIPTLFVRPLSILSASFAGIEIAHKPWKQFGPGNLQFEYYPATVSLVMLTDSSWRMQWKLSGAPFLIFPAVGLFSDERFHRKSIWKTALWPFCQSKNSERPFLKMTCPCIHQGPAACRFILLWQRDKGYKELLMGISDFRDAQFVWVFWAVLLRDNHPCVPISTFREKEA